MTSDGLLGLDDIEALIDVGAPESRTLEYKASLPGGSDDDKREFLYDVSAMANSAGGTIIFGVEQKDGKPVSICGCRIADTDKTLQWLENVLRNGLAPRLVGHRIATIPVAEGAYLVTIDIPRSLSSPHVAMLGGMQRFYVRNSNGKHPMDVSELRVAFIQSASLTDQIRAWRDQRLKQIEETNGAGPKFVLHLIPFGAFGLGGAVDVRELGRHADDLRPMTGCRESRYNLDGIWSAGYAESSGVSYAQAFRTGQLEVCESAFFDVHNGDRIVASLKLENDVIGYLGRYLGALAAVGVAPPIVLSVALLGAQGYRMATRGLTFGPKGFDRPTLIVPEIVIESYDCDVARELKPLFDALWNASGFEGSPNYDSDGSRSPKR